MVSYAGRAEGLKDFNHFTCFTTRTTRTMPRTGRKRAKQEGPSLFGRVQKRILYLRGHMSGWFLVPSSEWMFWAPTWAPLSSMDRTPSCDCWLTCLDIGRPCCLASLRNGSAVCELPLPKPRPCFLYEQNAQNHSGRREHGLETSWVLVCVCLQPCWAWLYRPFWMHRNQQVLPVAHEPN